MNEADWHALAQLLEGLGLAFGLADTDGRTRVANRLHQPRAPGSSSVRGASLTLSDGRRLTLGARAETERRSVDRHTDPDRRVPNGIDGDIRFKLLAEHSIDLIVAVDADLAIRYASPATETLLGCAPRELHGHTLAELLVPEERAAFIARHFTRSAQRGQGPDLFRALRSDGGTLWVEARVAPLPPGNGLGDYLVTLRDANQRKRAEEVLGQANAELSALASTDALTGLANRRQFDATLQKEWYRALRDGTPLGLLMIDVDRFKALNDLYGHQVGDGFLARVGGVIRDNVRRAGDMAARYGGEEFAVILPGTAPAGALEIGEHIRRAVQSTNFGNVVAGGYPVTVSVGLAASVPLAGGGAHALVHSADAALYQAKRNGRNRVEILQ